MSTTKECGQRRRGKGTMEEVNQNRARLLTDDEAHNSILQLQAWAKAKYGERQFAYYVRNHIWRSDRTRSGRRKSTGSYYTSVRSWNECPVITKDEYDANVADGKKAEVYAFMGRRRGISFDTYEVKQIADGWQDYLARLCCCDDSSSPTS